MIRESMLAAAALLGLAASPARADRPDPVDHELTECLDKPENQSTAGMTSCMTIAEAAYDRALEAVFQQVTTRLDPASRDLVRTAQRQWSGFRHAEEQAQAGPWSENRGALTRIALLSANLSTIKQRIDQLSAYLPDAN